MSKTATLRKLIFDREKNSMNSGLMQLIKPRSIHAALDGGLWLVKTRHVLAHLWIDVWLMKEINKKEWALCFWETNNFKNARFLTELYTWALDLSARAPLEEIAPPLPPPPSFLIDLLNFFFLSWRRVAWRDTNDFAGDHILYQKLLK